MNTQIALDKCAPFITSQVSTASTSASMLASLPNPGNLLAITISRQSGSGAHAIAEALAEYLQIHGPDRSRPWQVFDRNLAEKVLQDHQLPARYARFMPEDRVSPLGDAVEELFGAHPSSWTFLRQTEETILGLAAKGNVILVGRGANLITRHLNHAFHVRLVGSLEKRARHYQEHRRVTREEALRLIREEDRGRRRYIRRHFEQDLDDPLLYNLVLNTDLMPYVEAAQIIGTAALKRLQNHAGAMAHK
jgi:cytidylate kinase